jgi:prophage antirepressor-like protein
LNTLITVDFQGLPCDVVSYEGRPAWRAAQVSRMLGYNNPEQVARNVHRRWAEELVVGVDYLDDAATEPFPATLAGEDGTRDTTETSRVPHRPGMLLFESGLHLVLLRTRQAIGRTLRRWLATEVLPQLRQQGSYTAPAAEAAPTHDARLHQVELQLAELRGELRATRELLPTQLALLAPRSRRRFGPPQAIEQAPDRGGVFERWLVACCREGAVAKSSSAALHASLVAWCQENREASPSSKALALELRSRGYQPYKNDGARGWRGVAVTA